MTTLADIFPKIAEGDAPTLNPDEIIAHALIVEFGCSVGDAGIGTELIINALRKYRWEIVPK
jgi:hypothetical protein